MNSIKIQDIIDSFTNLSLYNSLLFTGRVNPGNVIGDYFSNSLDVNNSEFTFFREQYEKEREYNNYRTRIELLQRISNATYYQGRNSVFRNTVDVSSFFILKPTDSHRQYQGRESLFRNTAESFFKERPLEKVPNPFLSFVMPAAYGDILSAKGKSGNVSFLFNFHFNSSFGIFDPLSPEINSPGYIPLIQQKDAHLFGIQKPISEEPPVPADPPTPTQVSPQRNISGNQYLIGLQLSGVSNFGQQAFAAGVFSQDISRLKAQTPASIASVIRTSVIGTNVSAFKSSSGFGSTSGLTRSKGRGTKHGNSRKADENNLRRYFEGINQQLASTTGFTLQQLSNITGLQLSHGITWGMSGRTALSGNFGSYQRYKEAVAVKANEINAMNARIHQNIQEVKNRAALAKELVLLDPTNPNYIYLMQMTSDTLNNLLAEENEEVTSLTNLTGLSRHEVIDKRQTSQGRNDLSGIALFHQIAAGA
ncbi:hypothetical protein YTPLAS73_09060 [Nitrosarchaeum sp.]|nr:hypothetical protein YTPLAS73_09060 [Nitrosarchaeum sp.]